MIKPKSVCYYSKNKTFPTKRDRRGVEALAAGFKKLGWDFTYLFQPKPTEPLRDVVVTSGWNRHPAPANFGVNHLVLDCGYLGDRRGEDLSLGWFGLNGLARNPEPIENRGLPFFKRCEPWTDRTTGPALVCGQVPTDRALFQVVRHYRDWLRKVCNQLDAAGVEVLFKPHPRKKIKTPPTARLVSGPLRRVIQHEQPTYCVGYSSNALVEAAVLGVYPVPGSPLALTWDIRTNFTLEPNKADREKWLDKVASQQFNLEEMSNGTALSYLLNAL